MPGFPNKARPASADALTLAGLPPADTARWVARRKAQVVAAVQAGLITLDEALIRYKLTVEEFSGWQRALYRHGLRGLQITRVQIYKLAERGRRRTRSKAGARPGRGSRPHA
jgi:hypothetical protein